MNEHAGRPDDTSSVLIRHRSAPVGSGPIRPVGLLRASLALVAAGILTQIAYPLLSGSALRTATILSVVLLAAASIVHAGAVWGRRGILLVPVAGGIGLAAETIGVHTGFPFGTYAYADTLGAQLVGVPLIVPLAWTMLAYPCLLLGRRLAQHLTSGMPSEHMTSGLTSEQKTPPGPDAAHPVRQRAIAHDRRLEFRLRVLTAGTGAIGLTGWDLFLDPQMVAQGHWSWAYPVPALPGVPGVPLTNYAGWLLVSLVMIAVLDHLLPQSSRDHAQFPPSTRATVHDRGRKSRPSEGNASGGNGGNGRPNGGISGNGSPMAVLAWTWCGSAVGNLVFFDRPWVALYGGLVMGVVVLPYLLLVRAGTFRTTGTSRTAGTSRTIGTAQTIQHTGTKDIR